MDLGELDVGAGISAMVGYAIGWARARWRRRRKARAASKPKTF